MRLVQLLNPNNDRKVAQVKGDKLLLLTNYITIYDLVMDTVKNQKELAALVKEGIGSEWLDYQKVWEGKSPWKWLPCFDHPRDVNNCMVSGTGLTHKASAENRDKMNAAGESQTDSMKIYFMGEEKGKPAKGEIGVQPEWFYKGNGTVLKGHLDKLDVPLYALDGGEEPEIAGVYVINEEGVPVRIGFATGNEYSDHVMEKINYLYLAPSKIRSCSIGPELVIDEVIFQDISGNVKIKRDKKTLWEKAVKTGEANMAHSLENLEYHHFKYANHRVPGQAHIHFFGTGAFSFGDGIKLKDGDEMLVDWPQMGKPLVNKLAEHSAPETLIKVVPIK
ncbi:AraD1 family protein [uncultured Arcticibacterium sp.]|uniref:AraD1 family protein n=1 Tax=uncultured Arcticibacterium sp. TaxID=2173042 RepID=UPI0030F97E2F